MTGIPAESRPSGIPTSAGKSPRWKRKNAFCKSWEPLRTRCILSDPRVFLAPPNDGTSELLALSSSAAPAARRGGLAAAVSPAQLPPPLHLRAPRCSQHLPRTRQRYQKKILGERIARLCGGIAIIQVGAQTTIEMKYKKLRLENALNAIRVAIEEGVVWVMDVAC